MAIKVTRHAQLAGQDMSTITRWTVQDNAELLALSVTDEDLGKIAFQEDSEQVWFLARSAPAVVWIDLSAQASANPVAVYDEGSIITNDLATTNGLNFVGTGVTVTLSGGFVQVAVPGGGGAGSTFLALSDTPASYGGAGAYIVRVNATEDGLEFVPLTSSLVQISSTSGAEQTDLAQNSSRVLSTGVYNWDGFADLAGGTMTVGGGTGLIRSGPLETDPIFATKWDAATMIPLPAQTLTYVWVNYNNGTPIVQTGTTLPANFEENIILGSISQDGVGYHPTPSLVVTANGFARLSRRFFEVSLLTHAQGALIAETPVVPLTFSVTPGDWWIALVEIQTPAFDGSGTDRFVYYWRDGAGGWNFTTGNQQIDNTRYDDGSGILATLTGSTRRGVHWVYEGVDGDMYVLYGRGNYTSTQAQAAQAPADLPPTFQAGHAALVGKIVVQNGQTSFESIESPFTTSLSVAAVTEHGALGGLTEDDHSQYALNTAQTVDPTPSDDENSGWRINTFWTNTTTGNVFVCTDATAGAAVWRKLTGITWVQELNMWPRSQNRTLNEWFGPESFMDLDSGQSFIERSYGSAADPVVPAFNLPGITLPYDAVLERAQIWGYPFYATLNLELAWYSFPIPAGTTQLGAGTQIGSTVTFAGSSSFINQSQDVGVVVPRNTMLIPCWRETAVLSSGGSGQFTGSLAFRQLAP